MTKSSVDFVVRDGTLMERTTRFTRLHLPRMDGYDSLPRVKHWPPPAGLGGGVGNCPIERFVAVARLQGWDHRAELFALQGAAEELVRPLMDRPVQVERETLTWATPSSVPASCDTPSGPRRRTAWMSGRGSRVSCQCD
ncbi:hypothetical protein EV652_1062 [Kribbella steppae]|uniref:Uncharacterized protein n=1 Tax=Kribbella steppae TaxID=2512223 RepID=A0A4V2RZR2_9ACTN|nr:hypothetical protein [Kribbella steppae]TCO28020.1 hypothetical protein EV652_1062 [Kribbella steppae]